MHFARITLKRGNMALNDILLSWLFFSFYRLWYPIITAMGFSSPVTLILIGFRNMFSICYLLVLTALGCLAWNKKGWVLSLGVALTWMLFGLLVMGTYAQFYGLIASLTALFAHGWLELLAVFYWVYSLRKACLNFHFVCDYEWASWKDLLASLKSPERLFRVVGKDVKKAWSLTNRALRGLWNQNLRKKLTIVFFLIFVAALIETYITPSLASSLKA
jgi:uncharacterized membrane protein SpoIIM required for sporulation